MALNEYLREDTYDKVLREANVSYKPDAASTALHTDICSPVATDPTRRHLDSNVKRRLLRDGPALWLKLIEHLKPDVILMSVSRERISRVRFPALSDWETIHRVIFKDADSPRDKPYDVIARRHDIDGQPAMLVFGQAAQTPSGTVADVVKPEIGERIEAHHEATTSAPTTG